MRTDPKTLAKARARLEALRRAALAPRERLTLSEWADRFARLSVETSSEPGRWKTFGPQRGVMDAMTDPRVRRVVVMKGVRIGFTKALDWLVGYHTHWDPAPILFFQPTDSDAQDFWESEILPMIRDVPEILSQSNIVLEGKSKGQWHTQKFKNGAILRLRGAAAEGNFRRLTTRINIADEIDDDNWNDKSGDKLDRLKKRGTTFWNSKLVLGGSPVLPAEQGGRTHKEFLDSDQRHYFVRCPHCDHQQRLIFGEREGPGLKWNEDLTRAWYQCASENECVIEESDKIRMLQHGEWIAQNPGHPDAGFHYPQLISQFVPWLDIAKQWKGALKAGGSKIKVFKNEVLGEPFILEIAGQSSAEDLMGFVADYGAEVPAWVNTITAGADVQKGSADSSASRFEVSIYGWGNNGRGCLIGHWILDEHPLTDPRAWDDLARIVGQSFTRADGKSMRVDAFCIDSHGGFSQKVYSWIEEMRRKGRRRWFAVRGQTGASGMRGKTIWPKSSAKNNPILHNIEVSLAKDDLALMLPGGAIEFPAVVLPGSVDIDAGFFKRLTREKQVPIDGRPGLTRWTSPSDQEPWDCLVYAYAATHALRTLPGASRWRELLGRERANPVGEDTPADAPRAATQPVAEETRIFVPKNPNAVERPTPAPGLVRVAPGFIPRR